VIADNLLRLKDTFSTGAFYSIWIETVRAVLRTQRHSDLSRWRSRFPYSTLRVSNSNWPEGQKRIYKTTREPHCDYQRAALRRWRNI